MTDPNRQTPDSPTTLRGVVDRLHDAANKEETSLNDVVEGLGHASFVPVLLVWLDAHTGKRLSVLVRPPMDRLLHLACVLCGIAMPVLELVPFTSSILGAAVVLLAMTLLVRDGLLALAVIGAAIWVGVQVV